MPKFAKHSEETKRIIIEEYLKGGITQKALGEKYGFHYRQIVHWCRDAGKLDEYYEINKKNRVGSASKKMPKASKLKISGQNSINWNGKKLDIKGGDVTGILIPSPDHPNANQQGYVYEHRLVMEDRLGRYLTSDEIIHHIDLDPTNNKIENLLIVNKQEHTLLHYFLQVALVILMKAEDLQDLTKQILKQIQTNPNLRRSSRLKHDIKRSKYADG